MNYLLDSVILIDHFNGIDPAGAFLARVKNEAAISAVTRAEVLTGFSDDTGLHVATRLLDAFHFLPLDRESADLAARLRQNNGWKLPDAFQAAVAQCHGLKLVTRNTRDFPPELDFVIIPYQV